MRRFANIRTRTSTSKTYFPDDFYAQLRANWPDASSLISLADTGRVAKGAYPERFVMPFNASEIDKLNDDRRAVLDGVRGVVHHTRLSYRNDRQV